MKNLKRNPIFYFFIISILSLQIAKSEIDEKKFSFFKEYIQTGQYEDAIQIGENLYKKYKKRDSTSAIIISSLLSKTTYLWYQFKVSDSYFNRAYTSFKSTGFNKNDYNVISYYLAETALFRNEFLIAIELLNNVQVDPSNRYNYIRTEILKGKVLSKLGRYAAATNTLNNIKSYCKDNQDSMSLKLVNKFKYSILLESAFNMLDFGNFAETDSIVARMDQMRNEKMIRDQEDIFDLKYLKAKIAYKKRSYYKASEYFLDAYNTLNVSDEDYRKYDALKLAAISNIKAGQIADYFKLFRRSDMLAFKKPLRSQTFRPGVFQLKLEELIESGQYSAASAKANEINRIYTFLPKNNPYHYEFLELKASSSENSGNIKEYRTLLDTLEQVALKTYSDRSVEHAKVKLKLAEYEWKYGGDLANSIKVFNSYYPILQNSLYEYSVDLIPYLFGYATAYEILGKNDSALIRSSNAYLISNKSWGPTAPETHYALAINTIHKFNSGYYKEILPAITIAQDLKIAKRYENHSLYVKSLNVQAGMYQWLGEFSKMNKLINKAYGISLLKEENEFYNKCDLLDAMVGNFIIAGNYFKAERDIKKAYELKLDRVGSDGYMLISTLMKKVELKIQKGELKESSLLIEQLEILIPKYFPNKSIVGAQFLYLKSKYFSAIADYKKSKELINQSIEMYAGIYGASHVRLYPLYAELAKVLLNEGSSKNKEANEMYEKAKKIVSGSLGESTPAFAYLLVQQAIVLVQINDFENASNNLKLAETFWTRQLGDDNTYIAEINYIRGDLNYKKKKYGEADRAYKKAAELYTSLFNKNYSGVLLANAGLARVAYMQNDLYKSEEIMHSVLDSRLAFTDKNFSIMSFTQKNSFWALFKEEFEFYNSLSYKLMRGAIKPKQSIAMYNYAIKTKGLLMNSDAKIRRIVFQSGDSTLIANYNEWLFQKEYYALVSTFSNAQLEEEKIDLLKMEENIIVLEKKISSKTNTDIGNNEQFDWSIIKSNLTPKSSAVELIRFRYFNHTFTDTIVYAALIIDEKTKDKPDFVFMDNGKKMEKGYLNYYRNSAINKIEDETSYSIFFEPIKKKIPDGNTIYFASEGVYTQLNPEMLYNPDTKKYALESNTFVFITNTKDVIPDNNAATKVATKDANAKQYYLYGNPQFYKDLKPGQKQAVPSLLGAEKEVEEIHKILETNSKNSSRLFGQSITEDTIKSLQSPQVLHISTHGYFMEAHEGKNEITNNPMLNSGLMLAESGDILENNSGYVNQTSGILTASEVMDLNFTNTNLVVLSACETGRGQVEVGEGVFGLQRAFLVAGAKIVVLSLFKVDDEATNMLMVKFYEKFLKNGGDYRKAFREAKQEVRKTEKFASPIYWGPFIMIEGRRTKKVS
ncbi:MAG: CHAT domain-containing protein [Bacteroidota bacterium]|nr:CHAT domain-containing protein [Bacteroidota bacterium]